MRIAVAYRTTFGRDFLVDLVGYRRHGHNEGDEPAYTQPLLYDRIRAHPTARASTGIIICAPGIRDQHASQFFSPVMWCIHRTYEIVQINCKSC